MTPASPPLVRLSELFPGRQVFAKCEFLAPSGCFKIRGATHLLTRLREQGRDCQLVVPSMGNTALGAAEGSRAFGFTMVGVVPTTISRAKDEKLRALGVELVKVEGGGSDLLRTATALARERGGYFVHPHLDPLWTDGYQAIADEILRDVPACRTLVFPLGGGGLLMGLAASLGRQGASVRMVACEPYNYPKYAPFTHPRARTVADGLLLEVPHPPVQKQIEETGIEVRLIPEEGILQAMRGLYARQGLAVEPSSAIGIALVQERLGELEEPVCVVLTGENITREDYLRLIAGG